MSSNRSRFSKSCKLVVRLIGHSSLPVDGCLSLDISSTMDWRLVQGVPPSPKDAETGSSTPTNRVRGGKWMDREYKIREQIFAKADKQEPHYYYYTKRKPVA